MIFVTVGTHEQQFDRLLKSVDKLREDKVVEEEVIIQAGYSTYEPKFCKWSRLYPYQEMVRYVAEARIVITHGGPSSFIMPLRIGKVPIVVPRQKQYGEHVDNHQVEFCRATEKRMGNIILVEDIGKLSNSITNYGRLIREMEAAVECNNIRFNREFEELVASMFEHKI